VTAPRTHALTVEIVGAPGAGKTTLVNALIARDEELITRLRLRNHHALLILATLAWRFLPAGMREGRQIAQLSWEEVRSMVYVVGWQNILTRDTIGHPRTVVFDHGPVFRLAGLAEFGPDITRSLKGKDWWDSVLQRWTRTLDLIIWLDAPLPVLVDRINLRDRWHRIKNRSPAEAITFLERYRRAYERVVARFAAGGTQVMHFDTSHDNLADVADSIVSTLRDLQPQAYASPIRSARTRGRS
jgi:broad-specificity NMP kinase